MRAFGLDVHRDFCEVAIAEAGEVRSAGRNATRVDALQLFAQSLAGSDVVALEATTGADRIVSLLQGQGIRVVVANTRRLRSISEAKAKTDRADARTLARLLASGLLDRVWTPDERPQPTIPDARHDQQVTGDYADRSSRYREASYRASWSWLAWQLQPPKEARMNNLSRNYS